MVLHLTTLCRALGELNRMCIDACLPFLPFRFIWVVRDFQLELKDEEGSDISPDQYLEVLRVFSLNLLANVLEYRTP